MKKLTILLIFSLCFSAQSASANSLDELLKTVKQDQIAQRPELKKREKEFKNKKEQQKILLRQAKKELQIEETISLKLTGQFEQNEKKLTELETKLTIAMGSLGELFGVIKQIAGDTKGQLESSVISAEYPGRTKFPLELAKRKVLPTMAELEQLWFLIQQEMTESGKVTKFEKTIILPSGKKDIKKIVRVGSFNLISDEKYLHYHAETGHVTELERQPSGQFLGLISDFVATSGSSSMAAFGLDPTRGTLLSMLVQAPSLLERIQQGGVVGYIILGLMLIGLILVGERIFTLNQQKKKIEAQLNSEIPLPENPLGTIMKIFHSELVKDTESLELKLEEAIIKATTPIERGLSSIKVLVGVAPLLGLLGTVTGMIATFQSITLFGTGDPKLMAGGISQALVTTVLGLVCAIPLLLLHNYVSGKAKSIIQIIEEQSAGLMSKQVERKVSANV